MNKKEQRKELELNLIKGIEEVLNKHNTEASKKIRKITSETSKTIAKKFFKVLKSVNDSKTTVYKTNENVPLDKIVHTTGGKTVIAASKKNITPSKTKLKK